MEREIKRQGEKDWIGEREREREEKGWQIGLKID